MTEVAKLSAAYSLMVRKLQGKANFNFPLYLAFLAGLSMTTQYENLRAFRCNHRSPARQEESLSMTENLATVTTVMF